MHYRPRNGTIEDVDLIDLQELSALRALLRSGAAGSIRVANDLSLAEVATSLGVSKTTVLRWERGERVPRGELALAYWQLLRSLMGEGSRVRV